MRKTCAGTRKHRVRKEPEPAGLGVWRRRRRHSWQAVITPPLPRGGCGAARCFAQVWQIAGPRRQALRVRPVKSRERPLEGAARGACAAGGRLPPSQGLCEDTSRGPSPEPSRTAAGPHEAVRWSLPKEATLERLRLRAPGTAAQ